MDNKNDLYNIWSKYDIVDDELMSDTQMMSLFRKEFDKNDIDKTLIEKFIQKPLSFSLLTPKGKRNKNQGSVRLQKAVNGQHEGTDVCSGRCLCF